MTINDFIDWASECHLNIEKLEAFEKFYGVTFSEESEGYFCALPDGEFLTVADGRFMHVLDSDTILFSNELISREFSKKNILPLVDLSDGVYICYVGGEVGWGLYSIADRALFCTYPTFEEAIYGLGLE